MRFHAAVGIALSYLASNNSYCQPQDARSAQTAPEAEKKRLREMLERDPNNKEALFALGRLLVEERDFEAGGSLLRRYIAIWPTEPGAWAYLVRSAAGENDSAGAADAQRQIAHLAPTNLALHSQAACWLAGSSAPEVTEQEFELVMSLASYQTTSGAGWYSRLGQCYEHLPDIDRATRAFQAAIELDSNREDHYFRLARLLSRKGMAGRAAEVMNNAIAHFPRSFATRVEAGTIELEAGNPERALELQRDAAGLDAKSPGVLSLLGRIQMAQRNYLGATASLEQAAKLAPEDAGIHFYAGQAWMKADQGTERAIEHLKRSLDLDASRGSTYYWLGSIYFHRNHDYRLAVRYLEQAMLRAPELEAAHQMLIQAYKRLGEDAKADEQLRRYQETVQRRAKGETPR
ncbi:MAG TPA: tetratricopeptide repeat protein [Candidatus Acidoferrum sp.]|nr:tetratricopeptide repeat protein [Candidatus Acidoferrum sp.]